MFTCFDITGEQVPCDRQAVEHEVEEYCGQENIDHKGKKNTAFYQENSSLKSLNISAFHSRAILGYLVDQYAKDDSLYPKEPKKKALVNQRLFFEAGTMDKAFVEYFRGKAAKLFDAFDILDKLLEGNKWLAGEKKTIADFSMVSSVASIEVAGFDIGKYPNVVDWYQNIQTTFPGYDETVGEGCAALKKYLESLNKL
ncbi:hypothetical protein ANN_15966 [Periplaneta americana]|uniref:GST C-terminal domain-containing protein n=1 Tax=Periplaneta americana TaxID=6978 RepID=A0ABQ8SIY5_PERAM|nr:hypothetical protein ANN_15966 [Periplaneta americana]